MNEFSAVSTHRGHRLVLLSASALAFSALPASGIAAPRNTHVAATYTVQNCNGSGVGSLREAAGLAVSGDTIDLSQLTCSTITVSASTGGQIAVKDVLIHGPGPDALAISGASANRIFLHDSPGQLTIDGVTLRDGSTAGDVTKDYGGGCVYSTGSVRLLNSVVRSCSFATTTTSPSLPLVAGGGVLVANNLYLENTQVTDNSVTIVGPNGILGGTGGGVAAFDVQAIDSIVSRNTSGGSGGGISTYVNRVGGGTGSLQLADSIVDGNFAGGTGGGIQATTVGYDYGTNVSVIDSTISGNTAGDTGGGFYGDSSKVTMTGSTVSGNSAVYNGGGIYIYSCRFFCGGAKPPPSSKLSLVNSTVSGNSSTGGVGGVYLYSPFYIDSSTIVQNTSEKPGGVPAGAYLSAEANGVLNNSILAFNTSSDGLGFDADYDPQTSSPLSGGNNFVLTGELTDMPNAVHGCPRLYPLGNYGGPTQTHALASTSPAIDSGATTEAKDQRGFGRVIGAAADVGSFERQRTTAGLRSLKPIDASFARCRAPVH